MIKTQHDSQTNQHDEKKGDIIRKAVLRVKNIILHAEKKDRPTIIIMYESYSRVRGTTLF
jgi:hypothetical protein